MPYTICQIWSAQRKHSGSSATHSHTNFLNNSDISKAISGIYKPILGMFVLTACTAFLMVIPNMEYVSSPDACRVLHVQYYENRSKWFKEKCTILTALSANLPEYRPLQMKRLHKGKLLFCPRVQAVRVLFVSDAGNVAPFEIIHCI